MVEQLSQMFAGFPLSTFRFSLHVRQIINARRAAEVVEGFGDQGGDVGLDGGFGIDAAGAAGQVELAEKLVVGQGADFVLRLVEEIVLPSGGPARIRPADVTRQIDPQRHVCQGGGQLPSNAQFHGLRIAEDTRGFVLACAEDDVFLADGTPGNFSLEQILPARADLAPCGVIAGVPTSDIDQQRPLSEVQILIEMIERVAGEQHLAAVGKEIGEGEIDGAHGAVKVDGAKQFATHTDEPHHGIDTAVVNGQPSVAEETVVQQAMQIERLGTVARHEGVSQDKVHVVYGIDAAEQAAEHRQPLGMPFGIGRARAGNDKGHLPGVELFARFKLAVGAAPHAAQQIAEFIDNDLRAEDFVREIELAQVVFVEEMAERAMADIVQERSHAYQAFDIPSAGDIRADFA